MNTLSKLEEIATQIRRDIVRMVHGAASGHPGGSLGCTDILTALFFNIMDYNTNFKMSGKNEDIFFLSNGHISPLLYATLARAGFFPTKELGSFRKINSRLQGHPATCEGLPGIRIASGSLGQGLSVAVGSAIGKKLSGDKKNVYVLMGDGEIQEGQIWEAAMLAAHKKLDNLIAFVDYNHQQIDGTIEDVISLEKIREKFNSFGWHTLEVNGHDMKNIITTIKQARKEAIEKQQTCVIVAHTIMGKGVDFMENNYKWHGIAPNKEQTEKALEQLPTTSLVDYS